MTSATSATSLAARHRLLPRSRREAVLLLLALALLPFFFIGGPVWLSTDLGRALANLGHIPFFALATLVVGSRLSLSSPGRWLTLSAIVLVLSIAIEFAQSLVGRSASWHDVLRNLTGAWLAIFWLQRTTPLVWLGRIAATSILAFEIFFFASVGLSQYRMANQLPVLANFENPADLTRWRSVSSELARSSEISSEGKFALKCHLTTDSYSGMSLSALPRDWSDYRQLSFDLYNPQSDSLQMTLRIHDARHEFAEYQWQYQDRFNDQIRLEPGWNHYSVTLASIEAAPEKRAMDLSSIKELKLFATGLKKPKAVYVDNFRLEK